MDVLAIYNHPIETLGTFKKFIRGNIVEKNAEELKGDENFDALIIMGGPMGVYEMDKYPFLRVEMELIRKYHLMGKRILGVCLGSQLLAKALGGRVLKGSFGQEIGIMEINLLEEFKDLFGREKIRVFQWHGDTFSLPPNAKLLAYSEKYFQAFRIGNSLGVQFHLEVNKDMVKGWIEVYGGDTKILNDINDEELEINAGKLIRYWLNLTSSS